MANDDKTTDTKPADGAQPEADAQATGATPEGAEAATTTQDVKPADAKADDAKADDAKPAARGGRKAATVAPKAYGNDDDWPLGGAAPHDVVRVYDPETSVPGPAKKGPAKPGERAVLVAVKGDIITRSVLRELGR